MGNSSASFKYFNDTITLKPSEKKYLRKARTAITTKIINKFSAKAQIPPVKFKVQGSFTMNTIIRPLNGEFDIDIGTHFIFPSKDRDNWPNPQTVSGWLFDAVKNHTSIEAENRTTCVRVTYKPLATNEYGYHVDLPIYGEYENSWNNKYTVIGMNDERKWNEKSDPLGFTNWFNIKCNANKSDKNQLVRLVKYLKAWKDFQTKDIKMPSGMILTILAAKNYFPNERDDIALYKILNEVHFLLWWSFSIIKPVEPKNDLVDNYSTRKKNYFMERLREFRDDAYTAINSSSDEDAIKIWQKHFGDRFT